MHEVMSSYELDTNNDMFTDYIQNLTSYKRRELNSLILECQDEATIRRYWNLKWKKDSIEDDWVSLSS